MCTIGALIISALYYLFVELRWHVGGHTILNLKPDWDNLFSFRGWSADRHDIRNVYEALLGTLFVKSLLADWRKKDRRAPAWYVVISPLLIVVVCLPDRGRGHLADQLRFAVPVARIVFAPHAAQSGAHAA